MEITVHHKRYRIRSLESPDDRLHAKELNVDLPEQSLNFMAAQRDFLQFLLPEITLNALLAMSSDERDTLIRALRYQIWPQQKKRRGHGSAAPIRGCFDLNQLAAHLLSTRKERFVSTCLEL